MRLKPAWEVRREVWFRSQSLLFENGPAGGLLCPGQGGVLTFSLPERECPAEVPLDSLNVLCSLVQATIGDRACQRIADICTFVHIHGGD